MARTKKKELTLRERWMDFLTTEGYRPDLQVNTVAAERARIAFKVEGEPFYLYLDDGDASFLMLSLSCFLGDVTDEPELLLAAANAQTRQTKGTKTVVDLQQRDVTLSVEWFSETLPTPRLLARMTWQCGCAAKDFFARIKEMSQPVAMA